MKESKQTDLTVNRSIEKARELDSVSVTGLLGESVKLSLPFIHLVGPCFSWDSAGKKK